MKEKNHNLESSPSSILLEHTQRRADMNQKPDTHVQVNDQKIENQ